MTKNKHIFAIWILFFFMLFSFVLFLPNEPKKGRLFSSNALKKVTKVDGNIQRIDYVDKTGEIKEASDLGFATAIITMIDEKKKTTMYYDAKGNPTQRDMGYYGILCEYDENGNNYHVRFLGLDGPIETIYGYSDIIRTFYNTGIVHTEKYYNLLGEPVCTAHNGYGSKIEYYGNEKRIIYLDDKDKPMMTGFGYAIVHQKKYKADNYDTEQIYNEFYYDTEGIPVTLSLGQYGAQKVINEYGQETKVTYLNIYGEPIVTNMGYTTVVRTYYDDNSILTERYYDVAGKPYSLSDGQYGIKRSGEQIIYLDENGHEKFNTRRLLYNQTWIIIPCVIIYSIIVSLITPKVKMILLVLYISIIVYLTLLFRESNPKTIIILEHYRKILVDRQIRIDIFKNIWLFIPLGVIAYQLYPQKIVLLLPIALSSVIEGIQLIAGIGYCELDDVISNGIGTIIGFKIGKLTKIIELRINYWKHK